MSAPALIHDPSTHKLGRKPRIPTLASHLKRAKFAELLKTLSPAPPVDNSSFLAGVGMLGNDVLSDCTSAAKGDLLRLWTGANGTPFNPTTEEAIEFYKISTGYDGTPATDQGGNMDVVADAFKTVGWAGHKISDDRVLPRTIEALHQGLFRYGAVDCGWNLPTNAQTQSVWTLDPTAGADGDPGSWGGHDAIICGFDPATGLWKIWTWNGVKLATTAWVLCYLDEALAYLSNDWALAGGKAPNGIATNDLETELDQVAVAS